VPRSVNTPDAIDEILRAARPEDFDGHSEFAVLSPEARLDWLFEAAELVREFKGWARPSAQPEF